MIEGNNNPWAGLASYKDPAKCGQVRQFCGRDDETYDVTHLIDNNILLTLYGKSGIGKTSLLNAGVFPKLRLNQYIPVSIRLGIHEPDKSFQDLIIDAIEDTVSEVHGSVSEINVIDTSDNSGSPEFLWNYFARHRFTNEAGQIVFPVVVFDQFEEVLRYQNVGAREKATILLSQLQYLADESHALEDCIVNGQPYYYDYNFRFVISIREDELYLLEECVDNQSLSAFKDCRYRLRPMVPEEARQVILVPGRDCIKDEDKEAVADRILSASFDEEQKSIDTLLLSLICFELFNIASNQNGYITLSLIERIGNKDHILSTFYERAMNEAKVSLHTENYLENHLITQSGHRNSVALEDILHEGVTIDEITKLCDSQLLRKDIFGGVERLEYTHDVLGSVAKVHRDLVRKKTRKEERLAVDMGFIFDTIPVLCFLFSILSAAELPLSQWDVTKTIVISSIMVFGLMNAVIMIPYRHTKDRNSIWFLAAFPLFIVLFIFTGNHFSFLSFPDSGFTDLFFYSGMFCLFYTIFFFGLSLSYVKKRSFKDSLRYAFTLRLYKENPDYKYIIIIELLIWFFLLIRLLI